MSLDVNTIDSVDAVSGGKVWKPSKGHLNNKVQKGFLVFLVISVAFSLWMIHWGATAKEDPSDTMTPDLWLWSMYDAPSFNLAGIIAGGFLLALLSVCFFLFFGVQSFKVSIPVSLLVGTISVFIALPSYSEVAEIHGNPETNPVSVWMLEKYNYEFIEFVKGTDDPEEQSSPKLIVNDLTSNEEKIVHYYEKDDLVYLAIDDNDFMAQVQEQKN